MSIGVKVSRAPGRNIEKKMGRFFVPEKLQMHFLFYLRVFWTPKDVLPSPCLFFSVLQDDKIQLTDFLSATLKPSHVKSEKVLEEGTVQGVQNLEGMMRDEIG